MGGLLDSDLFVQVAKRTENNNLHAFFVQQQSLSS